MRRSRADWAVAETYGPTEATEAIRAAISPGVSRTGSTAGGTSRRKPPPGSGLGVVDDLLELLDDALGHRFLRGIGRLDLGRLEEPVHVGDGRLAVQRDQPGAAAAGVA